MTVQFIGYFCICSKSSHDCVPKGPSPRGDVDLTGLITHYTLYLQILLCSQCSVTCGVGVMERRVECMAENGWSSDLCLKRLKPDAQKKCYVNDCK